MSTSFSPESGPREVFQAFLLLLVPLALAVPLCVYGALSESTAMYVIYAVYIVGAIAVTKCNGRGLKEIGLSREGLGSSVLMALAVVAGALVGRLVSGVHLAAGLTATVIAREAALNLALSGPGQEILFRGLLFFALWRWRGARAALAVSSVLFGAVHLRLGAAYMLRTAVIGAVYGYAVYRTRNVVGPMLAHGVYNFVLGFLLTS